MELAIISKLKNHYGVAIKYAEGSHCCCDQSRVSSSLKAYHFIKPVFRIKSKPQSHDRTLYNSGVVMEKHKKRKLSIPNFPFP